MKTHYAISICVIVLVTLLAGCGEVLNEFYISNHTDKDVRIIMTPRFMEQVNLSAGDEHDTIERSVRSSLNETIPFEQDGDKISFVVPAHTTAFIGFSSGGNEPFKTLSVQTADALMEITSADHREYFTVQDPVIGAIVHVLDLR